MKTNYISNPSTSENQSKEFEAYSEKQYLMSFTYPVDAIEKKEKKNFARMI